MHNPKGYEDRLEIENGQIVRILRAEWFHKRHPEKVYYCDVYKENDAGEAWTQNLYQSMWGGYCVAFPGLPYNEHSYWYYDPSIAELEGWDCREKRSSVGYSREVTGADIDFVCQLYPNFRYLAKKSKIESLADLMSKLELWISNHDLELVLAAGFEKVGMNKNFWRLTPKNRKETCLFMRKYPLCKSLNLKEVRDAMRSDNPSLCVEYFCYVPSYYRPDKRYPGCYYSDITFEVYKYLKKARKKFVSTYDEEDKAMNQLVMLYRDYKSMLHTSEHPENDDYWRFPSDLNAFHNRLVEENRIKEEARILARAEEERKENEKRAKAFKRIAKKFAEVNGTVDGYSIFVTDNYNEWEKQAKTLHQCICACGYYQGTADGEYTIVFIQKEGVPVATAQFYNDGGLGQFYGDEIDRANCKPSEQVRAALEKWLETVPKSKFKKAKPRQRKSAKKEAAA